MFGVSVLALADGNSYVDFCLGDTGAMAGHSPPATVAAVHTRLATLGGATTMMPTTDAAWVSEDLSRRFGDKYSWSFTLSATDANRNAIRFARHLTKRSKVLVVSYCYHGSVDESLGVRLSSGKVVPRPGNVGPPVFITETTRVVEFNDLKAMEVELAHGDVACVLMEVCAFTPTSLELIVSASLMLSLTHARLPRVLCALTLVPLPACHDKHWCHSARGGLSEGRGAIGQGRRCTHDLG